MIRIHSRLSSCPINHQSHCCSTELGYITYSLARKPASVRNWDRDLPAELAAASILANANSGMVTLILFAGPVIVDMSTSTTNTSCVLVWVSLSMNFVRLFSSSVGFGKTQVRRGVIVPPHAPYLKYHRRCRQPKNIQVYLGIGRHRHRRFLPLSNRQQWGNSFSRLNLLD